VYILCISLASIQLAPAQQLSNRLYKLSVKNETVTIPAKVFIDSMQACSVHYSCLLMSSLASKQACSEAESNACAGIFFTVLPECVQTTCSWELPEFVKRLPDVTGLVNNDSFSGSNRRLLLTPDGTPETTMDWIQVVQQVSGSILRTGLGAGIGASVATGLAGLAVGTAAPAIVVGTGAALLGYLASKAVDKYILEPGLDVLFTVANGQAIYESKKLAKPQTSSRVLCCSAKPFTKTQDS